MGSFDTGLQWRRLIAFPEAGCWPEKKKQEAREDFLLFDLAAVEIAK
jgi:hypothetical protein